MLEDEGWTGRLAADLAELNDPGLVPARVFTERRGTYSVFDGVNERAASLAGRLRHRLARPGALPVVGDWVALGTRAGSAGPAPTGDGGSPATIQALLHRRTEIARRAAGERGERQVLVANVDTAVVLMGVDGDFNLRRLERYLVMVRAGGVDPLVLLTKADLSPDGGDRLIAEVEGRAPGTPVAAARLVDREAALPPAFVDRLRPGQTLVLLGSSGVGKSTLLNRLAGSDLQRTGAVRRSDSRGRHTTTTRQMFRVAGGALVIDTPGLREIQLADGDDTDERSVDSAFPEIAALAVGCRFRDCRHADEPGCAVASAAATGAFPPARLASYRSLRAERERDPAGRRRRRG